MNRNLVIAIVVGAALAAAAPARAQERKTQDLKTQDLKTWRHGVLNLKSDAGFVMMPMQHGFPAKHGLKIDVVQVKDGAIALKALIAGDVDSIDGGAGEGIIAAIRGADVKIAGCHWPGLPHALFVRGAIDKVADLKGKNIATSAPGSLPDNMMRTILEQNGIPVADVKFAAVGGDVDRYKALTAGIVDATIVSSEYLPISPAGIKILVAGRDVLPNFMRLCLNITGKTITTRREDSIRFLATEIEGLRYAMTHREETIKLATELSEAKPGDPRPAYVYDEFKKYRSVDPEIALPMDKLAWMQDQFVKNGSLPRAGDLSKIVDPTLRVDALKMAGK